MLTCRWSSVGAAQRLSALQLALPGIPYIPYIPYICLNRFAQGFKHRPDLLEVEMSHLVRTQILNHLREGLDTFCAKNTLHAGQCLPWVALVLEEASRLTRTTGSDG
jgi:hypothetical protein